METEKRTGLTIDWLSDVVVAHDLPAQLLETWTFHDKAPKGRGLRLTSVTVLSPVNATDENPVGVIFTGISSCSDGWTPSGYRAPDQFCRKDAFNRAFGRALQKFAAYLRGQAGADGEIDLQAERYEIDRWIANAALREKMDFLKAVYEDRLALASLKGRPYVTQA